MTVDEMKGNWTTLKGKIKEKWGKLTDDELDVAEGQLEQVAGNIAARYAIAKEKAMEQLKKVREDCPCS